jgi:hypothetical protein
MIGSHTWSHADLVTGTEPVDDPEDDGDDSDSDDGNEDVVKTRSFKASNSSDSNPDVLAKTGKHSQTPPNVTSAQIHDALSRMDLALARILGVFPAFVRPPYGDYDEQVTEVAFARGQSLALWDWDTGDADGNSTAQSEAVYKDIVEGKVRKGVVLEHETVGE